MKRKFVKENKAVLREFVGSIISAIVTGKLASDVSKRLNADPVFKNKRKEMEKLTTDLSKRMEKYKKSDPEFYNHLKKSLKY
tara:strand:- start:873 stop:1118 length:246 start_codon:yes stop_codon:yes gene_type:complete